MARGGCRWEAAWIVRDDARVSGACRIVEPLRAVQVMTKPTPPPSTAMTQGATPARNGLELMPPRPERWICDGFQRHGRPCGKVLMDVSLGCGGFVRIRCSKCGHWNTWVAY